MTPNITAKERMITKLQCLADADQYKIRNNAYDMKVLVQKQEELKRSRQVYRDLIRLLKIEIGGEK